MYTYNGIVKRVVDGDTYDITIDLGFGIYVVHRIRLEDVDTPETYGKATVAEKEHGKQATEFCKENLLGKDVIIHTKKDKKGKYGRYIATVYITGVDKMISQLLIENDLVKREEY